jgi:hypothetical protein
VELTLDIHETGRIQAFVTSWPLPPPVERCLGNALARVQFDLGLARSVRVQVAR